MVLLSVALLPSLWLSPSGVLQGAGSPRLAPGVQTERGPGGAVVYSFDGRQSGIAVPEIPRISRARCLTISAWVWPRQVQAGPGQIVFRGDDRDGLDPFQLVSWPDGTIHFGIGDPQSRGIDVSAPLTVGRWTHVTATFDDRKGKIGIYLDGKLTEEKTTDLRMLTDLEGSAAPGIGIGNIQNPLFSHHNQPFDGKLSDIRIYPFVVTPREAGYAPEGWNKPYGREIVCG
ncbi:MAG: LamG domain-containing protein [Fimbriimonas sp.]